MPASSVKKKLAKRASKSLSWHAQGKRGELFARSRVGEFNILAEHGTFMLTLETKDSRWEDLGSSDVRDVLVKRAEARARRTS